MRRWASSVVLVACVLLGVAAVDAQPDDAAHRSAVDRLVTALRTMAMIEHFALPLQIRSVAVDEWGFDGRTLGLDEILAIERHVDIAALRDAIAKAHMTALSTEQALEAARFFESEPARRVLASQLADGIPSSDPLRRANLPPPSDADVRAFEQFATTPVGKHLVSANPSINERAQRALEAAVDSAIQKYVAAQRLPNTRRPGKARP